VETGAGKVRMRTDQERNWIKIESMGTEIYLNNEIYERRGIELATRFGVLNIAEARKVHGSERHSVASADPTEMTCIGNRNCGPTHQAKEASIRWAFIVEIQP